LVNKLGVARVDQGREKIRGAIHHFDRSKFSTKALLLAGALGLLRDGRLASAE
jgi:hypothetical protein